MTEAQGNFATALAEFGCGSDEDSLIMGEGGASSSGKAAASPHQRLHLVACCTGVTGVRIVVKRC